MFGSMLFFNLIFGCIPVIIQILNLLSMKINSDKYQKLRAKLDNLHYTQTLHPDSLELVEKILNDYTKTMTQFDKFRSKNNQISKSSTTITVNEELQFYREQTARLTKEIEQMKRKQPESNTEGKIEELKGRIHEFKIKFDREMTVKNDEISDLTTIIDRLKIQNKEIQKQNSELRNRNMLKSQEIQKFSNELTILIEKKGRQIRELEETNSKLRIKNSILEKSVEQYESSSRLLQNENKNESNKMIQFLKQEIIQFEKRIEISRIEIEEGQKEKDLLKRQIKKLREDISAHRYEQEKTKTIQNVQKMGRQKIEQLYTQTKTLLNDKIDEFNQLKDKSLEDEREIQKLSQRLKEQTNKVKHLSEKNNDLVEEIQQISTKMTSHVKKIRELEGLNLVLEKQLKEFQQNKFEEKQIFSRQKISQAKEFEERQRKQLIAAEREIKMLQNELNSLKEDNNKMIYEREKQTIEIKKLQTIISEGNKNLQINQLQKEELMRENRELKSTKDTMMSSDYSYKNEMLIYKQKIEDYEIREEEFINKIRHYQNLNKDLESEILKLNNTINKSQEKNKEIFEDNKMMVNQIKLLEQRKNQLVDKIKTLHQEQGLRDQDKTEYKKQFIELTRKYAQLQQQLNKKDQHLLLIDNQRDDLQNLVDAKTEQNERLKIAIKNYEKQSQQLGKVMDEKQYGLNGLQRKIAALEQDRSQFEREADQLARDKQQLMRKCNILECDLHECKNEINILVLSSKESKKEVERAQNRLVEVEKKLRERTKEYEEERARAGEFQITSNELQQALQQERGQNIRFKGWISELETANSSMYNHLEQRDREVEQLRYILDQMERKETQLLQEISSSQRQAEALAEDLQRREDDVAILTQERNSLRAERNWKRQSSDWKIVQEQKIYSLQQDLQLKKRQVEQLRSRVRELEAVAAEERAKNFNLQRKLDSNRQESLKRSTPVRPILIESRVESQNSQNWNSSNTHSRERNQSEPLLDNHSEDQSEVASYSSRDIRRNARQLQSEYETYRKQMQKFSKNRN